MRKRGITTGLLAAFAMVANAQTVNQGFVNHPSLGVPAPARETRAVWLTTVFNIDWPASSGNTTSIQTSQRALMNTTLDQLQAMNINTVIFQVRSQCDAMYPSTLEPWSNYLTGRMGRAPAGTYDPLQEWITACKARGMWCMAWFNPYRALTRAPAFEPPTAGNWDDAGTSVSSTTYLPPNHVYRARYDLVRKVTASTWWMDPGVPDAAARAKSAIMDVVNRYDVDGIVFDDYFYPSGVTTAFDSATYAQYGAGLTLANWRRKNTDNFVQDISQSIKAAKPNMMFGIGPNGIWVSGQPSGTNGQSAYNELYADTRKWLQQGWVDFLSPQLYWTINSVGQSYTLLSNWWAQQNIANRHLWISNAAYRLDAAQGDWAVSELENQVGISRNLPGSVGNVWYNTSAFQDNLKSVRTTFQAGVYAQQALVPTSPWLPDQTPPARPSLSLATSGSNYTISFSVSGEQPRWIRLAVLVGATWQNRIYPGTTTSVTWPRKTGNDPVRAVAVASVDRLGNMSQHASRTLDATALLTSPRRN